MKLNHRYIVPISLWLVVAYPAHQCRWDDGRDASCANIVICTAAMISSLMLFSELVDFGWLH